MFSFSKRNYLTLLQLQIASDKNLSLMFLDLFFSFFFFFFFNKTLSMKYPSWDAFGKIQKFCAAPSYGVLTQRIPK